MGLHFTDASTLTVSLVTGPDYVGELAERGRPDSNLPMRLQTIFFDASSGRVRAAPGWPTPVRDARIIAARNGKFVTLVDREVTLYGADFKVLKTLTLPRPSAVTVSPSEKTILFVGYKHPDRRSANPKITRPEDLDSSWLWVSFDDLRVVKSWEEPRTGHVSITDDAIAMVNCTYAHLCEPHLAMRNLVQPWVDIAPAEWGAAPVFLTDDLVLLTKGALKVFKINGKTAFRPPPRDRSVDGWTPCEAPCEVAPRSVGRFIFLGYKTTGRISSLDVAGQRDLKKLLIYDISPRLHGSVLAGEGTRIRGVSSFALSPDALRLAILNHGVVQVFALPGAE
jgi:hypothetical protein